VLPLTGIVVGLTAPVLIPLAFFAPRLLVVKQRGLIEFNGGIGYFALHVVP
jgi:hypothetical protein